MPATRAYWEAEGERAVAPSVHSEIKSRGPQFDCDLYQAHSCFGSIPQCLRACDAMRGTEIG
eukprot:1739249-Rhodomonas_salina.1